MNQRLPSITARKAIGAPERAGFVVSRTSGSHCRLIHPGYPTRKVTIRCTPAIFAAGTLRSIIAQAGLTVPEFIALL